MRDTHDHEHCWHVKTGPIYMVIKDGHVVEQCCHCPETRQVHRDHRGARSNGGHAGDLGGDAWGMSGWTKGCTS